jgi:HsdM N-terminal domain/N-6 DNA Methylase
MEQGQLSWVANFIWGIADDVLRDLYVRGKYRDVILPMTVLRRLDAVLEPTKQAVLDMKVSLDKAGITNQDQALRQAAGQAFYNTSKFTLGDLKARASQQQLKADFEAYLDGFSPNVQDILDNFEFRNQIPRLSKADALGTLIEKFTSPDVDLSPRGLDNHGMGTVFEELVRRFNEENNEEAGEHWTPRDAVKLMANLVFLPIADEIESGTYLLYDGACGTGGVLTVGEDTLQQLAARHGKQVATHLYGQEINAETYAICKADLLLKGETDPNKLHDLKTELDGYQVYTTSQIDQLVALYLGGADRDKLDPILDACVAVYKEQLNEDGQVDFKGKAKAFLRAYGFLSSILPYTNADWEKRSIFLNFLVSKLPAPVEEDLSKGILEAIDMDSYRVEKKAAVKIQLQDSDAEIEPVPTTGGGHKPEPELDRLSNILKVFNDQFGNIPWTDADRVHKLITEDIPNRVAADKAYQNAKQNSDKQNARIEHDKALARVMTAVLKDDTELFKQFMDNEGFRRWLTDTVFGITYEQRTP